MSETGFDVETLPADVKQLVKGGRVFQALGADPKYRGRMLEIIKEASPDTPIPELDLQRDFDARVTERVKPVQETNEALRKEVDELKARLETDDRRRAHDLTDADLVEIDALKKEAGITKDETAIELHRARQISSPRPTVEPGVADFQQKLRKINPRNVNALKNAAIQEGSRLLRESRQRRYA